MEIWVNEECTKRPIKGEEYDALFIQVNAEIPEQCPNYTPIENISFNTCKESSYGHDILCGNFYYPKATEDAGKFEIGVYEALPLSGGFTEVYDLDGYSFGEKVGE